MSHPFGIIAGMSAAHFSPWAEPRPCWHYRHFAGMLYGGTAAACTAPGSARVRAMPVNGCAGFEREVGADDELGPPAATVRAWTAGTSVAPSF